MAGEWSGLECGSEAVDMDVLQQGELCGFWETLQAAFLSYLIQQRRKREAGEGTAFYSYNKW